jgi:hypothetical protein
MSYRNKKQTKAILEATWDLEIRRSSVLARGLGNPISTNSWVQSHPKIVSINVL